MSSVGTSVEVRRVTGTIGAEITGVRVGPDLPGETVRAVRDAVLEHKVLFFRGQHHLDDAAQAGFAQLFGEMYAGSRSSTGEQRGLEDHVTGVDSRYVRATDWHADNTCSARPHSIMFLRAVKLPSYGGDTAWANAVAAYQSMPDELRELADELRVVHSNAMGAVKAQQARIASGQAPFSPPVRKGLPGKPDEAEHPLVRVLAETGERAFVLGKPAASIVGRSESESRELIDQFQGFVTRIDNTVRWHWALGDIVMWDNRATQHCAIPDYDERRVMYRCLLQGDRPIAAGGGA
jgi:alpha-ketoglutarate-dependent taurine dioxygenase